jgi:hypothetical protein
MVDASKIYYFLFICLKYHFFIFIYSTFCISKNANLFYGDLNFPDEIICAFSFLEMRIYSGKNSIIKRIFTTWERR